MLLLCFFGRNGQLDTAQAVIAMHMLSQDHFTFDKLVGAGNDRHFTPADVVEYIEGILGGILEVSVAGRGGDSKEMHARVMCCVNESKSVVKTGITI